MKKQIEQLIKQLTSIDLTNYNNLPDDKYGINTSNHTIHTVDMLITNLANIELENTSKDTLDKLWLDCWQGIINRSDIYSRINHGLEYANRLLSLFK